MLSVRKIQLFPVMGRTYSWWSKVSSKLSRRIERLECEAVRNQQLVADIAKVSGGGFRAAKTSGALGGAMA